MGQELQSTAMSKYLGSITIAAAVCELLTSYFLFLLPLKKCFKIVEEGIKVVLILMDVLVGTVWL